MIYKKILVTKKVTIKKCFEIIISTGIKCLAVHENNNLLGTISDGDLRRGILKGKKISDNISDLYNINPFTLKSPSSIEKIDNFFVNNRFEIIPYIDKKNKIINVFTWKNFNLKKYKFRSLKNKVDVVIMAGGRGTRLLPYTSIVPKPLLLLNDKPIIDLIIDNFSKNRINNFHISLNFKASFIKSYINTNYNKFTFKYITEKKPLGTVGSLSKLFGNIKKTIVVSNCDILVDIDYYDLYEFHKKNNYDLTIVSALKTVGVPYGNIELDQKGNFIKMNEKPVQNFLINTGLYIFNTNILGEIPKNTFLNFDKLVHKLKRKKFKIGTYPINEKLWKDIGQSPEYDKRK